MKEKVEYILCSAIHYEDSIKHQGQPKNITTGFVIVGRRHHNCIAMLPIIFGSIDNYEKSKVRREHQGFLTSFDRYVDRKEAYLIAKSQGQLLHNLHDENNLQLFSEDLY